MNRKNIWTPEQLWILNKRYPIIKRPRDLVPLIGRPFSAIRDKAAKLKLKRQVPPPGKPTATPEEDQFIKANYLTLNFGQIGRVLNRSSTFITSRLKHFKLVRPDALIEKIKEESRLKPGNIPPNRGRKQSEYMTAEAIARTAVTRFKKGSIPPNYKPVGTHRIDSKDGCVLVKLKEGMFQWKLKHRVIYEQHFGPIPKGCNVEFKDRNKRNFDPENLILRTRKENMLLNTIHNYPKEIATLVQLRGALNRQINKKRKAI